MPFTLSKVRACAVATLSALLLLQATASSAECRPAKVPPSEEYRTLVTRYIRGERAAALTALGSGVSAELRCDLDNLEAAAVAVKRCREQCEDRLVFERFPVRAAILLHAEREVWDQFPAPVAEQSASCGTGSQAQVVERLIAILVMVDPDANAFLSRFYVAMARRAHWSHCLTEAEQWARTGLKRLPKDGTLLLTLGIVLDTNAFLTLAPAPRTPLLTPQAVRQFESLSGRLKGMWETVRSVFEQTVAADPNLQEARLRLGRVLWRLNRPDPARAEFETVLAKSSDPTILYLAHLFVGRIHEDKERFVEAEAEYRAALSLRPLSEPAAVAVSQVRLVLGDAEGAREILDASVERFRERTELDPFKRYPMTHAREGQTLLDELWKEAAR